jgi:hypothetical protein
MDDVRGFAIWVRRSSVIDQSPDVANRWSNSG